MYLFTYFNYLSIILMFIYVIFCVGLQLSLLKCITDL